MQCGGGWAEMMGALGLRTPVPLPFAWLLEFSRPRAALDLLPADMWRHIVLRHLGNSRVDMLALCRT